MVTNLWDILNPSQRGMPFTVSTSALEPAEQLFPAGPSFNAPTQAVPRGHGGSFDEACQSILVPTAVSWEGDWTHNDPHVCLRGWRQLLHSEPQGRAPAPQQRGKWLPRPGGTV